MTYTINLNKEQISLIINKYRKYQVETTTPYMIFRAKINLSTITIYQTNKLLIQGNKCEELYQEICALLNIKSDINKDEQKDINVPLSIIGTDEVGTGDYFGGIVVCGCFIEKDKILEIMKLGVKDSKKLDDKKIIDISPILISKLQYSIIYLDNEKYNQITKIQGMNLNKIKAILHNKVILKLIEKNLKYDKIIIDGFTTKSKYLEYLQNQNQIISDVTLEEKGEDKYLGVAAASIIARYYFVKKLHELSKQYGYILPKGAGHEVDIMIEKIIRDGNGNLLKKIAKLNFKNTNKIKT